MPYTRSNDLPEDLKNILPDHAQHIYIESFNSAWEQYDEPHERKHGRDREETAHAVAWSAVKQKYEKGEDGKWVEK